MQVHDTSGVLTSSQVAAVRQLGNFLSSSSEQCFILLGYAGTGKTFLIGEVVADLMARSVPFVLMAPTGRAAKVLSKRVGMPASTIHKAIYAMDRLKEYVVEDEDGTETFKFYYELRENTDNAQTVYVVDEASMVSDDYSEGEFFRFGSGFLLRDLMTYLRLGQKSQNKKVIFVGDPAQLPPVGSNSSPALDSEYLADQYNVQSICAEMIDVVRQRASSGILGNATTIRDAIRTRCLNVLDIRTESADVREVSESDVVDRYLSLGDGVAPEHAIIVGYSNALVNDYNRAVRARQFPGETSLVGGDRLVVVANNHSCGVSLMNGDLAQVVAVSPAAIVRTVKLRVRQNGNIADVIIPLVFREVNLEADRCEGDRLRFKACILENLLDSKARDLGSNEQRALYVDFKVRNPNLKPGDALFKDALKCDSMFNALRVKYGYAVTCHKAQGGEWPHVFVDFAYAGGVFNLSYFRWVYTAITRARDVLHVVNPPRFSVLTVKARAATDGGEFGGVRGALFVVRWASVDPEYAQEADRLPVARQIYMAVSLLLESSGIAIEKTESCQYSERYQFRQSAERAVCMIYYNAQGVVTSVQLQGRQGAFGKAVLKVVDVLTGKRIVVEGGGAGDPSVEPSAPVLECPHHYMQSAYAALVARAQADGIALRSVKVFSPYHLYCEFAAGGHQAAIDYHFNASGRITRVASRSSGTTNADLARKLLAYSG